MTARPEDYDNGGILTPGCTLTTNTSGQPELVLTADELPQAGDES